MPNIQWSALEDDEFVKKAEVKIWLSVFAITDPRAPAHREADLAYDEAQRRGKPWLYQKAWNEAAKSAGRELSDTDRAAAIPSSSD